MTETPQPVAETYTIKQRIVGIIISLAVFFSITYGFNYFKNKMKDSPEATSQPVQVIQMSFRERYNALAEKMAPDMATRECTQTNSFGKNRDTLFECPLVSPGAQLNVSGLNNRFTAALLELDVKQLSNPGGLAKAGRILLRLARDKDNEDEDPVEMTWLVIEAQENLGLPACVDTPEQHTRFCVVTADKRNYSLAIINPEMWK